MGQQHSIRQPDRFHVKELTNENYGRIIPPSSSVTEKEQLEYIINHILVKYDKPRMIDGQTIEYYIPKGTKLYHSSLDFYQSFDGDRITFFGIDIIISLWYLVEMNYRNGKRFGVIYEFDVIEDIPVYILKHIKNHPYDPFGTGTICRSKEFACIHPQYAYHQDPDSFGEMSMEVTMNLSNPLLKASIRQAIHPKWNTKITYVVDINILEKMAKMGNYTFHEFNPIRPNMRRLTQKQRKNMKGLIVYKNEQNTVGAIPNVIKGFLSDVIIHNKDVVAEKHNQKTVNNHKNGGRRRKTQRRPIAK